MRGKLGSNGTQRVGLEVKGGEGGMNGGHGYGNHLKRPLGAGGKHNPFVCWFDLVKEVLGFDQKMGIGCLWFSSITYFEAHMLLEV